MSNEFKQPRINNIFSKKNIEYGLSSHYNLPYDNASDFKLDENQIIFTAINNILNRLVENDLYNDVLVKNITDSSQYRSPRLIKDPSVALQKIGGNEKYIVNDMSNPNSDLSIVYKKEADLDHSIICEKYSSTPQHLLQGKYVYFVFNFNGLYFAGTNDGFWQSPNRYVKSSKDVTWHRCDPLAKVGGFGDSFEGRKVTTYAFNSNIGMDSDNRPLNKYQFILAVDNELYGYYPIKSLCGKKDHLSPFKKIVELPKGVTIQKIYCNTDDGVTYIATDYGLFCLSGLKNTTPYYAPGTYRKNVYDVIYLKDVEDPKERIMIATSGGILQSHTDKTFKNIKVEFSSNLDLQSLLGVDNTLKFIGTNAGIYRANGDTYKKIPDYQTAIEYVNPLSNAAISKMLYMNEKIYIVSKSVPGIFLMDPKSCKVQKITKVHNSALVNKTFDNIQQIKYNEHTVIYLHATDGSCYLAMLHGNQVGSETQINIPSGLTINNIYVNERDIYLLTTTGVYHTEITGFEKKVDVDLDSSLNLVSTDVIQKIINVGSDKFMIVTSKPGAVWYQKIYKNHTLIRVTPSNVDSDKIRNLAQGKFEINDIVQYGSDYMICANGGLFKLSKSNDSNNWSLNFFDETFNFSSVNKNVVGFCYYQTQDSNFEVVVVQDNTKQTHQLQLFFKNLKKNEKDFSISNNKINIGNGVFYKCYLASTGIVLVYKDSGNTLNYATYVEKKGCADISKIDDFSQATSILVPSQKIEAKYSADGTEFYLIGGEGQIPVKLQIGDAANPQVLNDAVLSNANLNITNVENIVFFTNPSYHEVDGLKNTNQTVAYLRDSTNKVYELKPSAVNKKIQDVQSQITDRFQASSKILFTTSTGVYYVDPEYDYTDHLGKVPVLNKINAFGTGNYSNFISSDNYMLLGKTLGSGTNQKTELDIFYNFYKNSFGNSNNLKTLKTLDYKISKAGIVSENVTVAAPTKSILGSNEDKSYEVYLTATSNKTNYEIEVPLEYVKSANNILYGKSPIFGIVKISTFDDSTNKCYATKVSSGINYSDFNETLATGLTAINTITSASNKLILKKDSDPTNHLSGLNLTYDFAYYSNYKALNATLLSATLSVDTTLSSKVINKNKLSVTFNITGLSSSGFSNLGTLTQLSNNLSVQIKTINGKSITERVKYISHSGTKDLNFEAISITDKIANLSDPKGLSVIIKKKSSYNGNLGDAIKAKISLTYSYPYTNEAGTSLYDLGMQAVNTNTQKEFPLDSFKTSIKNSSYTASPYSGYVLTKTNNTVFGIQSPILKSVSKTVTDENGQNPYTENSSEIVFASTITKYNMTSSTKTDETDSFMFLYTKNSSSGAWNKYRLNQKLKLKTAGVVDEDYGEGGEYLEISDDTLNISESLVPTTIKNYDTDITIGTTIGNEPCVYTKTIKNATYNSITITNTGKVYSKTYLINKNKLNIVESTAFTGKAPIEIFKVKNNINEKILAPYITGSDASSKCYFRIVDGLEQEIKTYSNESIKYAIDVAVGALDEPVEGSIVNSGINFMTVVLTQAVKNQGIEIEPSKLIINGIDFDNVYGIRDLYSYNNKVYGIGTGNNWYRISIDLGKYILIKDDSASFGAQFSGTLKKVVIYNKDIYLLHGNDISKVDATGRKIDSLQLPIPSGKNIIDFYTKNNTFYYTASNFLYTNVTSTDPGYEYPTNGSVTISFLTDAGKIYSTTKELSIQDFLISKTSKFTMDDYALEDHIKDKFNNGNVDVFAIDDLKKHFVFCASSLDDEGFYNYFLGSSDADYNGKRLDAKVSGMFPINKNTMLITGSLESYIFDLESGKLFPILIEPLNSLVGTVIGNEIHDTVTIEDKTYIAYGGAVISFDSKKFAETMNFVPPFGNYRCFADKFKDETYRIIRCVDDDDFLIGDELGLCYVINRRIFRRFPNFSDSNRDLFDIEVKVVEAVKDRDNSYTYLAAANNLLFKSVEPYDGFDLTLSSVVEKPNFITGIYHEGQNNLVICTSDGIYNTEFNYMIENELGDGSLSRFYKMVKEQVKNKLETHISKDHNTVSLITLLNKKASTDLANCNFKSTTNLVYNTSKSLYHIKDDIVKSIEYETANNYIRAGINNVAMPYVNAKSTYAKGFFDTFIDPKTKEEISLKNIPYIAKFYESGLKEINIFVPTTGTFYQNNVNGFSGSQYAQASIPRENIGNGASLKNSLSTNSTKLRLYLYNGHFELKNIIAVQITGSSLPLKIYQDNTYYQEGRAGMFDTVIQPSIMTSLPQSIDETPQNVKLITDEENRICLDFEVYGTDAQSIRILAE